MVQARGKRCLSRRAGETPPARTQERARSPWGIAEPRITFTGVHTSSFSALPSFVPVVTAPRGACPAHNRLPSSSSSSRSRPLPGRAHINLAGPRRRNIVSLYPYVSAPVAPASRRETEVCCTCASYRMPRALLVSARPRRVARSNDVRQDFPKTAQCYVAAGAQPTYHA